MPRVMAFLRAINVGGHVVTMKALCEPFIALGFEKVETFIASGNVIFETRSRVTPALEAKLAKQLEQQLGYEVATFLRTAAEVATIAAQLPFSQKAIDRSGAFVVGFLATPLPATSVQQLMELRTDIDDFAVIGREVYWLCSAKQSDSTFSNTRFEKSLGVKTTFRGMNTIRKLATKYPHS